MAKLLITIEDYQENGQDLVRCVCEPSFEIMMKMLQSGSQLTAAHGYALHALNSIREQSQKQGAKNLISIPKLKKLIN